MKTVSIIILNFNGTKETIDCLKSIQKLQVINYKLEVIVVDNGSTDDIGNFQFQISNFKLIKNKENLGFSGGNNVGIRYALQQGADYVVILNNDTIVDKNIVVELLKVAESDKKNGIVVPKIYFAKGHEFHTDRYTEVEQGKVIWYAGGVMDWNNIIGSHRGVDMVDNGQFNTTMQTEFATGCCMMVKKEVFMDTGLFDEKYFLYYEDADLSVRVKRAGYKIVYASKAYLWHINAAAAGGSGSELQDYYTTRNRIIFGIRYASLRSKLALVKESVRLIIAGRQWQKRGIIDFILHRFGKGSYSL